MAVIHSDVPSVHRPERRNFWFAVSSVALFLCTIWMFYADYHREWKKYQRQFRAIEIARAQEQIGALNAQYDSDPNLAALHEQLQAAQADLEARKSEVAAAQAAVDEADRKFFLAETEWKISKSYWDAEKYELEEAREHQRGVAAAEAEFKAADDRYHAAVLDQELVKKEQAEANEKLKGLTQAADEAERKISAITMAKTRLETKLESIGPSLANTVRDRPVVDFLNPSIKVQQVQLPDLLNDVNFLKIGKVDRCATCHLASPEKGFEDYPQPFTSHPHQELMVNASSAHPYGKFGCTTCHEGLDRATYFESAMHTPGDEEERERWVHEYGWEEPHYWDNPMLPTEHTEAACLKCHRQEVRLAGAPRLNRALDTIERAGCFGCHKIRGFEDLRKTGPDLRRIGAKTTFDWAYAWVSDPPAFRPTTWMPKFFHLTNTSAPEDEERSKVEIDAILKYVFDTAEPFEMEPPPARGDAARGRQAVEARGCLGCHRIGEHPSERGTYGRSFGPALDRVGDKVNEAWLFHWVKNPKEYFPGSYMPNLRLTDQEASDIAAYLMSLRASAPPPAPAPDEKLLDDVTLEYLKARLTDPEAKAKLASMGKDEKRLYLGERLISRYGCSGCHLIKGFEDALPIGVELTTEGSKLVTRLDFGFVEIEHTREDWFFQKLKDPRIFDQGKIKAPQEKLKMPDFGFTDEEASTMVTLILGLVKDEPRLETVKRLDPRESAVEAGRRIVTRHNCRGCHIVEGTGGAIREVIEDPGYWPPNLIGEGKKVQSDWLFSFLKEPVTVRPWLTVHMPTFAFTDEEAGGVGHYFAALDEAPYPFVSPPEHGPGAARLAEGEKWFTALRCLQCHVVSDTLAAGVSAADLAPNLTMAKDRLRRDWIVEWLKDPQKLQPGTRMPNFFYSDGEQLLDDAEAKIGSIRDYLMELSAQRSRRAGTSPAAGKDASRSGI